MTPTTPSNAARPDDTAAIDKLPHDELLRYGRSLGLDLDDSLTSDEIAQRVHRQRRLLRELDREGLLDVIKWARRPVRRNANKEELALEIARIDKTNYDSLSRRGLRTLARLREIAAGDQESTEEIIRKLRKQPGLWERWHRKRRRWIGSWLSKMIDGETREDAGAYQFLPDDLEGENEGQKVSLKRQIEDHGVVGGLASRLRGAADDYIKIKMDEIEARIDEKLDQIDQRLAEWRDREVANRLKILRITLVFTVLVAILSLGYNYVKHQVTAEQDGATETTTQAFH
ncbi:MAG: hypothetical protein ACE5E1_06345 [Phycisphaerae bacterium]